MYTYMFMNTCICVEGHVHKNACVRRPEVVEGCFLDFTSFTEAEVLLNLELTDAG